MNSGGVGQHQAFWEIVTQTSDTGTVAVPNVYGAAGYGFVALTQWLGNHYQFYVYSYWSGASSTFQVWNSNYTGDSADFVIERGLYQGNPVPLANFYYLNYLDAWVNGNTAGHGVGNYPHTDIVMKSTDYQRILADAGALTNNVKFQANYHQCK